MPSRDASGDQLRRIKLALSEWRYRSDAVQWDDKEHVNDFLASLERLNLNKREIVRQLDEHVKGGGSIKEQDNPPSHDYDTDVWYKINLPVENRKLFVKFVLDYDEDEYPGIRIVNIHW